MFVALGWVTTVMAHSVLQFLGSRIVFGLGVGLLMPANDSLISKVVPEEKRGLAFGFFGTSLGILSLSMPWIGAQLWERFTPQTPFWITALACAIMIQIACVKFALPRTKKTDKQVVS